MKHFFFPDNTNLKDLLFLNIDDNNTIDKLKRIYDAADLIYDKRIYSKKFSDSNDDLHHFLSSYNLEATFLGNKILNVPENIAIVNDLESQMGASGSKNQDCSEDHATNGLVSKIKQGLLLLWNYVTADWQRNYELCHDKPMLLTYYYLTASNIARRLSQGYFVADNDVEKAEIWGERAIELVWHGKEIAYSHREEGEGEWRLLWLLSEFNTGVYHQDYANRNRRSNYDSAEDHYKLIFNYFHNLQSLKPDCVSKVPFADQMFLIYMETHRHWMTTQRRRRRSGIALQYARQFIKLLKNTQAGECVFPKEGTVADILKTDIMNDNSSNEIGSAEFWKNAKRTIEHPSNNMIENCNYSCKRVCLLSILDLARCYLSGHELDFYNKALYLAFSASSISNDLDQDNDKETIVKNIDALIIISSALRKIFKHQGEETIDQDLQQFRENCMKYSFYRIDGSGEIETTPSFITELEWLADQGHLESKYELIKWYCLLQEENWVKKSLKNNGWISSDDKLAQFTPITIKDYLQDNKNNPMLRFYKGMVELHTCHYKNAIKTLEELLDKRQKYTNYIRPGTLGLKARYLLANAYMHLAEYSKAMRILKELYDTLESLSASSHESFKDERIIVDLAYCYIKKGDFDNALNTYEPVLPPTVRLLLGIKELRAKNNKRAIQIFDAVKITAQNKADQDENDSLIKNVEILLDIAKKNPLSEEQDKYLEALKSDKTGEQSGTSLSKIKSNLCERASDTGLLDALIAELSGLKARLRHAGVNNLLTICVFLAQTDSGKEMGIQDIARKLIEDLEDIDEFSNDTETNYLRGLFVIMTGKVREERPKIQMDNCLENSSSEDNSELDVLSHAQTCFEKSCKYSEGFISQMTPWNVIGSPNKEATRSADKGVLFNKMAYISAYLINLISLYNITKSPGSTQSDQSSSENAAYKDRIKHFIEDIPKSYVISMKAAIALAKWLITYEGNPEEKTLLYRSFSFVTIFEERGAAAFNELRTDPAFRLLRSENRGEVLAYLLAMYEPINALKEECTYGLEDKRYSDRKGLHLVQYTKLSRLKDMLKEGYPEENPNSQKASLSEGGNTPKSQLRLSNCAYVNDIFEGRRFFEYMSIFAEDNTGEGKENSTVFWQRVSNYFRQLERDEDEMMPSASEVYTASFSIKEDSFPLWSIYGDNEAGCNIEFAEDFFDIDGGVYFYPDKLREYIPSRYIDSDYPLYIVQYIDRPTNNANDGYDKESSPQSSEKEKESLVQSCGTRAIKRVILEKHLNSIYKAWKKLDIYLNTNTITKTDENVKNTVIRFAADRLNEVRFLFKDPDYAYEGEIRVVYTDEPKNAKGRINYEPDPPHQYVKMERKIKDLTIRLGSKVSDYDVDRIVSWLHKTGQVKKVVLAKRNRYVGMSFSPRSKK